MSVRHQRFSVGGWQAPSLKFYLHYRFTRTVSGPIPDIAQEFRKKPVPPRATKKVGHREPGNQKFQFGQSTVTLETGRIARQASGAVLVTVDDDVSVLVTVVGAKQADPGKGFFPLSVHYQEKTYAAGKILAVSSSVKAVLPRKKP